MLNKDGGVAPERVEEAEILSKAFADAAGGYFVKYANLEEERIKWRKVLYVGTAVLVLGFLLLLWNQKTASIPLIGAIICLIGAVSEKKVVKEQSNLEPDKKLLYLSKLYVPIYAIPYSDGKVFIFDGKEKGVKYTLDNINYDIERVQGAYQNFAVDLKEYMDFTDKKDIAPYRLLEKYDKLAATSKIPEKK